MVPQYGIRRCFYAIKDVPTTPVTGDTSKKRPMHRNQLRVPELVCGLGPRWASSVTSALVNGHYFDLARHAWTLAPNAATMGVVRSAVERLFERRTDREPKETSARS
jgi:hypothetical protein